MVETLTHLKGEFNLILITSNFPKSYMNCTLYMDTVHFGLPYFIWHKSGQTFLYNFYGQLLNI